MIATPTATHVATFTVQGEPRSKARPRFSTRNGKVVAYTPRDTKTAEDRYRVAYLQAARAIETDPFAAFTVEATFYCGTTQRRDVDNMLKAVLDGLHKTAWPDDAQVVEVVGRKTYVPKSEARSEVTVRKVGELNMPIAQCVECGEKFKTYDSTGHDREYCSQTCRMTAMRRPRLRNCAHCNAQFEAHSGARRQDYCSPSCANEARKVEHECITCGAAFKINRSSKSTMACSRVCLAELERARPKATAPDGRTGRCVSCGGVTSKKKYTHCQACRWSQPRKMPAGATNRGNQKVTESDVRAIREKFNDGVPRKDIAAEYGISVSSVASIGHRRTWKSVA